MTEDPNRVVDAHAHFWDPARADWYPFLAGRQDLGMGDISGMARRFDAPTYFAEAARWRVEKIVHVAAAASAFTLAETMELEELASTTGHPAAIVGALAPADSVGDVIAQIDHQMAASRFRGVRAPRFPGGLPGPDVLRALQERDLVFELMAHPDGLQIAADALAKVGNLTVVVEHTGWPRTTADDERRLWLAGMTALAELGNVSCKLSGLAMPLGSMDAAVFRPWIEPCLELFGIERCMFASNFPVDGLHGSFDELYETYSSLTASFDPADRERLFAGNAERLYRL